VLRLTAEIWHLPGYMLNVNMLHYLMIC